MLARMPRFLQLFSVQTSMLSASEFKTRFEILSTLFCFLPGGVLHKRTELVVALHRGERGDSSV